MAGTKEYTFKVKPKGNSNINRLIQIESSRTLDDLHYAIMQAFDLDEDHLYMFSRNRAPYDRDGYYSPFDDGKKTADNAVLAKLGWKLKETWLYLYDFGDDRMFNVTLVKEVDAQEPAEEDLEFESESDNILRDYFSSEDWEEEEDFDIMQPIEVLPANKTMEKLLKKMDKEELETFMSRMGIELPEVGRGKRRAPAYASAIVEALKKDMEPLLRILTGESKEFLLQLSERQDLTLADCLGMLGEIDIYYSCGLVDLEDFSDGVIRLTQEARECAALCREADKARQIELQANMEKMMKRLLNLYGVMEVDKMLQMLNSQTGSSMEIIEFYDSILVPGACWDMLTVMAGDEEETIYVSLLEEEDAGWVIEQREEFPEIEDYRQFSAEEWKEIEQGGIIPLVPSLKDLMDYFIDEKDVEEEDCMMLVSELIHEGLMGVDIENFIAVCGELLRDNDIRMTRRVREMVESVLDECPSAVLKGYSEKEYREKMLKR